MELWKRLQMRLCEHTMHASDSAMDILVTAHLLSEVTLLFSEEQQEREKREQSDNSDVNAKQQLRA